MQDHITEQELKERLSLIERMIAEGRRNTESWGWTFVLWGIVYYLAIAWSAWGHSAWAWPATILIGVIVTVVVAALKAGNHPETTLGRAIGASRRRSPARPPPRGAPIFRRPRPRQRNSDADHGLRAEEALFSLGREHMDAGAVHGVARRACESRRKVELPRQGDHLAAREAVRVFENDQRLAGEFAVREDVERMKAQWLFHQTSNSPCISRIVTLSRYSMSSTINPSSNLTNSASSTTPRRPVPR